MKTKTHLLALPFALLLSLALTACPSDDDEKAPDQGGDSSQSGRDGDDKPSPSCTGTAASCYSYSPGDCSRHGCSLDLGSSLDSDDDECDGTPYDCKELHTQEKCGAQVGCRWKP